MNPTISQLEHESVQYAMEVLESFNIDFKQTSKLSIAKAMANKTLEQVLLNRSINFDSTVKLPPRLNTAKNSIKELQLFRTY